MIYIASPYSSPHEPEREFRYQEVCELCAHLFRSGIMAFSPIAHCHGVTAYGLPQGFSFWQGFNRDMIARCDSLMVYQLPGWEKSTGVKAEIGIAHNLGKPVAYMGWPYQPKKSEIRIPTARGRNAVTQERSFKREEAETDEG